MRWFLLPVLLLGCTSDDPEDPKETDTTETDTVTDTDTATTDSGTTPLTEEWPCTLKGVKDPDFAEQIGCQDDFDALASLPLDASIPGARSIKTIIDRIDGNGGDPLRLWGGHNSDRQSKY